MDIFDEVTRVLQDLEKKELRVQRERQLTEGLVLTELISRYNIYVAARQWEKARSCLHEISRLSASMLQVP